ncbi:MAG: hypothetical protein O8C64_14155 [Candidatus Methanoperedens sp.]|nr:hypothetical protein [Candidatus Methanoperedens sp.]MCZ7404398.1 hypothetical protein [Candidatus Methanoperedens sp.]
MPVIRNKLNQRILIHLKGGKHIDLSEKGTADVADEDLSSSHLQDLMIRENVVLEKEEAEKTEMKKSSYMRKGK